MVSFRSKYCLCASVMCVDCHVVNRLYAKSWHVKGRACRVSLVTTIQNTALARSKNWKRKSAGTYWLMPYAQKSCHERARNRKHVCVCVCACVCMCTTLLYDANVHVSPSFVAMHRIRYRHATCLLDTSTTKRQIFNFFKNSELMRAFDF